MKSRVTGMNRSGSSEAVKEAFRTVRLQANHISRTHVARNAHWRLGINPEAPLTRTCSWGLFLLQIYRIGDAALLLWSHRVMRTTTTTQRINARSG
jgi:hypothetical protein